MLSESNLEDEIILEKQQEYEEWIEFEEWFWTKYEDTKNLSVQSFCEAWLEDY